MTTRFARRWAPAPALAVVALLALSACRGGDQGGDVASAGGDANPTAADTEQEPLDEEAQALAFAQCMRDEGVEMPDPDPGSQEGFIAALREARGEEGEDHERTVDEEYEEAFTACEDLLPEFIAEHEEAGRDEETTLALAECLRDQGLDVPDDLFGEDGGGLHDIPADELNAALEACREVAGGFTVEGGGDHGD